MQPDADWRTPGAFCYGQHGGVFDMGAEGRPNRRGSELPLKHSEWWIERRRGGGAIDVADEDSAGDEVDGRGTEGGSSGFPAGGLEPAAGAGDASGVGAVGGAELCDGLGEVVADGAFGEAKLGGDFRGGATVAGAL